MHCKRILYQLSCQAPGGSAEELPAWKASLPRRGKGGSIYRPASKGPLLSRVVLWELNFSLLLGHEIMSSNDLCVDFVSP